MSLTDLWLLWSLVSVSRLSRAADTEPARDLLDLFFFIYTISLHFSVSCNKSFKSISLQKKKIKKNYYYYSHQHFGPFDFAEAE